MISAFCIERDWRGAISKNYAVVFVENDNSSTGQVKGTGQFVAVIGFVWILLDVLPLD